MWDHRLHLACGADGRKAKESRAPGGGQAMPRGGDQPAFKTVLGGAPYYKYSIVYPKIPILIISAPIS